VTSLRLQAGSKDSTSDQLSNSGNLRFIGAGQLWACKPAILMHKDQNKGMAMTVHKVGLLQY
jgi:hypothetical protein